MPVHHRPKDAESTEPRGHGSLKGGVDTVILIEAGNTKKATVTKQKDGETGLQVMFGLLQVSIGQDEDGEDVTSCVVQPTDRDMSVPVSPTARAISKLSHKQRIILAQLNTALEHHGERIPDEIPDEQINRNIITKVVRRERWREQSIEALGDDGKEREQQRESIRRTFNVTVQALQSKGITGAWGDFVWAC